MIANLVSLFLGGLALGLASSIHCSCMCGGLVSGALFLAKPRTRRERIVSTLCVQAGRIGCYAFAGALAAGIASDVIDPDATAASFRTLQFLAASALVWIGFATAGLLPTPALAFLPAPGKLISRILEPSRRNPQLSSFATGVVWGLNPCPMVYAALMSSALTGSFQNGAVWMTAFGLGTLPGLLAAMWGVMRLAAVRRTRIAETAAGLFIAGFGFSTVYYQLPTLAGLCVRP
jgi:uncharacterized protein